jgi:hypothetical protein
MKIVRAVLTVAVMALAMGGLVAPNAWAKTYHATVQCQIVRISDNNVVAYDRADGEGNTEQDAINDAARNINVPPGHYKRHCDAKRIW